MAFTPNENFDLRERNILPDGGTQITAFFPIGERTPEQCNLVPGAALPRESPSAGIVGATSRPVAGMKHAVVRANKADYYQAVQSRTATVTGVHAAGETTLTATSAVFYPSIAGESIVITAVGTFAVASYTSPTVVVLTGDATCAAAVATFDEGSRRLNEASSDVYGIQRDRRWLGNRRYHCEQGDRDAEMQYLRETSYAFDASTDNALGLEVDARALGRDPMYPHMNLIEITFIAADYYHATVQDVTGTAGSVINLGGVSTLTATTAIFYPSLVGETIVIGGVYGSPVVTKYNSQTEVVIEGALAFVAEGITFDSGRRMLSESTSDAYRWNQQGRWSAVRRYHCLSADRDVMVSQLGSTTYTFNADDYNVVGKVYNIDAVGRDPNFPRRALITVTYEAPFNPVEYPVGRATIRMRTSNGNKRLQEAETGTYTGIETEPDKDGYYYKFKYGTNVVPDGNPVYEIRTAILKANLKGDDYKTLASIKGTTNAAAAVNIGNAGKWELRCLDVATGEHLVHDYDSQAIPVMFVVEQRIEGVWTEGCVTERRRRYPKSKPVLHSTDDPFERDPTKKIYLEPGGGASTPGDSSNAVQRVVMQDLEVATEHEDDDLYRNCYNDFDWRTLNTLLSWNAP